MTRIIFVCATGIATSTVAAKRVQEYIESKGITNVTFDQINVASVQQNIDKADLIISTTNIPYDLKVPVINALPLMTGIREEKVFDKIDEFFENR